MSSSHLTSRPSIISQAVFKTFTTIVFSTDGAVSNASSTTVLSDIVFAPRFSPSEVIISDASASLRRSESELAEKPAKTTE